MAEAVVSFVVEQLGLLSLQKVKFLFGVGDQVQRAVTDLEFMKGFLKDADAKHLENETIRKFVVKTRDAAYDLEDAVQTYLLKLASRKGGRMKKFMRKLNFIRLYKIGSEIKVIVSNISDLRRNLESYDILRDLRDSGGATSIQSSQDQRRQQLRRVYSHVPDRNVVGVETGVDELVRHLVEEEHRHRVISISGMGGCGKSTIAKQVHHHKDVKAHFDCFAWVSISQQYQVRDVLESIYVRLTSATDQQRQEKREEISRWKDEEIPGRLSRLLNEKKCLIILDDIWKTVTWDHLKAAFECDGISKSRILLTTRNERVASHADVNGFHYIPPPLSETQSWELFEAIALRGRTQIDSEVHTKMEEIGRKMVPHCAGLPLAISVLAGLLARKDSVKDWETIQKNVIVHVSRGYGDRDGEHAFTSWVLGFSYDDLPYHLKPCFLYFGLFPEDHVIRVNSLTRLWIAEGFISLTPRSQELGETMEEVAYCWFNELVERYLIQVERVSSTSEKVKTCKVHDLLRDLCLSKAKEENFLQVVKFSNENGAKIPYSCSNNSLPMGKIRRLAVYLKENAEKLVPSRDERGDHVRSLLYFGPNKTGWFPQKRELISSMFKYFKLLRVLRLEGMRRSGYRMKLELPSEIGKMVHLRFLSLRNSDVLSFPSFLGNLVCLQTLDFRVSNMEEPLTVPNVILKMNRLRHLYLPYEFRVKGILKLSTLHELQTLKHLRIRYCDLLDLTELGNLRKLLIRSSSSPVKNLNNKLNAAESVLKGIRSLYLYNEGSDEEVGAEMSQILARCSQIYKLTLFVPTTELPEQFHSYLNLTWVMLIECTLKEDQVAKIGKLPNLKSLRLWGRVLKGNSQTLVFSKGSFPRLQQLVLFQLKGINEWMVEEGAMLGLCQLKIRDSPELRTIPDGLRHIVTLKELVIERMPEIFCKRLEEDGEDFYKVQHIPSRTIRDRLKDQTHHASTSA